MVSINQLLQVMVDNKGSDLHLAVGRAPTIRIHGRLRNLTIPPLNAQDTLNFVKSITPPVYQKELEERGGADFSFSFGNQARFRAAIFKQRGNIGLILRQISNQLMTFEEIGLPESIKYLLSKTRGLFLVTGPTGSGKTTTLASIIDFINNEFDYHIVTIEDPIEYYHDHKCSIITQREIGSDVPNFSEALYRILRMDPDVILLGEMRDLETIRAAITAAETGHLVFGTLHTTGAARTVDRIIDVFPQEQHEQIRMQLASSLIAVISQALIPRTDKKGRIACFEIMISNAAISNLIRENKTYRIPAVIQTSKKYGMCLLDESLFKLFTAQKIGYDDMLLQALNPGILQQKVKEMKGKNIK